MENDTRIISTAEELKVVSDPFRLRIIHAYSEHGQPLTVKGCADILGEVPAKVHYHVKKLLSIHVLELDHIEVVNGINAKFYKLPKARIQLQIEENEERLESNMKHITNVAISHLENFKLDFIKSTTEAVKDKGNNLYDVGWLSNTTLYLTNEEFDEVQKSIFDILDKYRQKDKDKNKYTMITGLSKKD